MFDVPDISTAFATEAMAIIIGTAMAAANIFFQLLNRYPRLQKSNFFRGQSGPVGASDREQ
jgi:hypothetical protein